MKEEEDFIRDIICQVLVKEKSKKLIYSVLNEFIPGYEHLTPDYASHPNKEDHVFESEDEMLTCFIEARETRQTFYWNRKENNKLRIMVGANILEDNQTVFSLTFNGTKETEAVYFKRLKDVLSSEIGVISYINPVDYADGKDFEAMYAESKNGFE